MDKKARLRRPLERYAAKRRFAITPEPEPTLHPARRGPLLFVVQKHAARRLHYDFRLELDGVLRSWAVPKGPSLCAGVKRMAVAVEDHPFEYASFEGIIPPGQYGAGRVIVWDCGAYSPDDKQEHAFSDRERAEQRVREGLKAGKLSFLLRGVKLKGSFALVRTRATDQWLLIKHADRFATQEESLGREQSVLSAATLEELDPRASPARLPAECLSPFGPIERVPPTLQPMLLGSAPGPPRSDARFMYEPKLDGYRVLAFVDGGSVRLASRRGLDLTAPFPELLSELGRQATDSMVIDGEVIALGPDGRPSFNALQNRVQLKRAEEIAAAARAAPAVLVCFDLLHFAGCNLRARSYVERRRYLTQCLLPDAHVQLVDNSGDAEELWRAALAAGFEGIVAKLKDSAYQPGKRTSAWLKIKTRQTTEFVIGGFTRGKGAREDLGALLLGYYEGRSLHYAGHVGSGLTGPVIRELQAQARTLQRAACPFIERPPLHRPTTWLEPQLVAEVSFAEWTGDQVLRAPVFVRLRTDIPAQGVSALIRRAAGKPAAAAPLRGEPAAAVAPRPAAGEPSATTIASVLEQLDSSSERLVLEIAGARLPLTHLERVYWPAQGRRSTAVTKRDLLRYLAAVSPYMLPHLRDRPLTMIRMPEGIGGERFFQKHWEQKLPEYVESVSVFSDHNRRATHYLLANNLATLLWVAQNGTLEFHVWHSRTSLAPDLDPGDVGTDYASSLAALERSALNRPDYLVFDIDPYIYSGKEAKGAEPELNARGFAMGRKVAFWLRALLQSMDLEAIVKTSGKTGLHMFVPIERTIDFDTARSICEQVGRHVLREHPRDITMEWAVEKRTGKIFIDYNMNVRGKTLNVAYSPRGVPGAPISMPLTWEEIERADPTDFTLSNAPRRLEKTGDRWHDALTDKQSLARAFGSPGRGKQAGR